VTSAKDDVHELEEYKTGVEENVAGVQRRLDRLEERAERVELSDAPH